jgi:predicted phosphodiesterase
MVNFVVSNVAKKYNLHNIIFGFIISTQMRFELSFVRLLSTVRYRLLAAFYFSFFIFHFSIAQQAPYKLFLVGDAGEDELTGETLDSLKSKLDNNPYSAVVFLGDNCYKKTLLGLTEGFLGFDSSKVAIKKMKSQLEILNGYKGSAYFVPGNHDWWNLTNFEKGRRKLKIEENFIEAILHNNQTLANPDATFFPKNGSPGPATADLNGGNLKIVFIDTNWLILLGFKKNPKENMQLAARFYMRLDSILKSAAILKQQVVVLGHHPVYSTGSVLTKHIKHPVLYPKIKQSYRDFPSARDMSDKLSTIFQQYPGMYYACGHVHALQYHTKNNAHYIISGSGSKINHVKGKKDITEPCNRTDCMLWNEKGFFEIDFYADHQDVIMYHDSGRASTKL